MISDQTFNYKYPDKEAGAEQAAVELTQELIRIPSLTPLTSDLLPHAKHSLDFLQSYLSEYGATCHRLTFDGDHDKWGYPVDNLYAEWNVDGASRHLCFLGHTDVVPEGNSELWSNSPFCGDIIDGWIYGRGATDMKGAVATFCAAVANLSKTNGKPPISVSLLITTDEEWVAINGTKKVLKWMHENGKQPDSFLVGEPSSSDTIGTHIKIGRRGSLCGTLSADGVQGHAAYQDLFKNPNRAISLANTILHAHKWDNSLPYFPETNFEIIAQDIGDMNNSSIVPNTGQALWNVRFTTEYTPEQIHNILMHTLQNPPAWASTHPDFEALQKVTISSNIETVSLPYYSTPGFLAEVARDAIYQKTGINAEFDGSGGTTDGRFIQDFFPNAEIIELGLPEKGGFHDNHKPADYSQRGGMHQIDERCSVNDIKKLLLFYQEIIEKLS